MTDTSTPKSPWLFLVVLIVAELTSAFEASMIYSALSELHRIYGDPVRVGWLVTAFLLVSAAAAAICGRLGDIYGRRTILLWMLMFSALGSMISYFSTNLDWIIFGRAVQGMSAAILPLCFGLVRECMPKEKIPFAVGVIAGTAVTGGALGYMAGGVIVDYLPWHTMFLFAAVMAVLGFIAVFAGLPPSPRNAQTQTLDLVGGILFVPGVTGIVFAVSRARSWGWVDARMIGLLAASLLLIAIWVRHELKQKQPLIDVRLLATPQIGLANLCFALAAFGAFQSQMILLPMLQQPTWTEVGLGISASAAGVIKGGMALLGMFFASWAGSVAGRRGGRHVLLMGAIVLAFAWGALAVEHSRLWFVLSMNLLSVFGMTVLYAAVPNLIVAAAPADRASEATGVSSVIRAIAGALGSQAIAYALSMSTITDPTKGAGKFPTNEAYTAALALVAATCLLCAIVAWFLPRPDKSGARSEPRPGLQPASN